MERSFLRPFRTCTATSEIKIGQRKIVTSQWRPEAQHEMF